MMDNKHIWEIDMVPSGSDNGIQLEIFSGRDKYTKAGLFSGPLRRQEIDPYSEDEKKEPDKSDSFFPWLVRLRPAKIRFVCPILLLQGCFNILNNARCLAFIADSKIKKDTVSRRLLQIQAFGKA